MGHAFILGGTGQIGRAVAVELLQQGWDVTLACRGGRPEPDQLIERGAKMVIVDREKPSSFIKALAGGADAVIDCVAFTEDHANQLIEIEQDVGAFTVISSSSVYCDNAGRTLDEASQNGFPDFPEPIQETQTTVAPGPATYSTQKMALEHRLLERISRPVAILRPCAIYGCHSIHPREWWFVKRIADGRTTIPLAYQGLSRFHTSAVENIAGLIGFVLKNPATCILNAADPIALSVAEIGSLIAKHLAYRGIILPIETKQNAICANIGRSPWSVPKPFILNTSAAEALGYIPATDYRASVGRICDWLLEQSAKNWQRSFPVLANYPYEQFDYAAEDRFLAGLNS